MAGADNDLVITCVENISRPEERRFTSTLSAFAQRLDDDNWNGPLIIFVGIGDERVAKTVSTPALQEVSHGTY